MCLGCNTRRMVETAAHLVEHVFPAIALRCGLRFAGVGNIEAFVL